MSGSFCYGLKARFYGLFIQLPWSFFVTLCVLMPVFYVSNQEARALLIELVVYWTILVAVLWAVKDLYTQRYLYEFIISDDQIHAFKKGRLVACYPLDKIRSVKTFDRDSVISRRTLGAKGMMITFDDGSELLVSEKISNYENFNIILSSHSIAA